MAEPCGNPEPESLRCPKCDYILFGLPKNRCPECGKEFDPQSLPSLPGRGAWMWAFPLLLWPHVFIICAVWCDSYTAKLFLKWALVGLFVVNVPVWFLYLRQIFVRMDHPKETPLSDILVCTLFAYFAHACSGVLMIYFLFWPGILFL